MAREKVPDVSGNIKPLTKPHSEEEWEALDKHRRKFLSLGVLEKAAPDADQKERAGCTCGPNNGPHDEKGKRIICRMAQMVVSNKGKPLARLIADLSMKKLTSKKGPNFRIPEELCKVPYIPKLAMIRRRIAEKLRTTDEKLMMWTIDVKSFFLNFKIREDCREQLGLRFKEGDHWEHYRYKCPPFGLRSSPIICCTYSFIILSLVLSIFPEFGDLLWIYVDDYGGVATESMVEEQFNTVARTITYLGLPIGDMPGR